MLEFLWPQRDTGIWMPSAPKMLTGRAAVVFLVAQWIDVDGMVLYTPSSSRPQDGDPPTGHLGVAPFEVATKGGEGCSS